MKRDRDRLGQRCGVRGGQGAEEEGLVKGPAPVELDMLLEDPVLGQLEAHHKTEEQERVLVEALAVREGEHEECSEGKNQRTFCLLDSIWLM